MNNYEAVTSSLLSILGRVKSKYHADNAVVSIGANLVNGAIDFFSGRQVKPLDINKLFSNVSDQARLTVMAASIADSYNYKLEFKSTDYKDSEVFRNTVKFFDTNNTFTYSYQGKDKRSINSVNDCFKCYCGLDKVLLDANDNKSKLGAEKFETVFLKVRELFNEQVYMARVLLNSKGDSFRELLLNAFPNDANKDKMVTLVNDNMQKRSEMYKFLKENSVINALTYKSFEDATQAMKEELMSEIDNAFKDEIIASRKQIIESTV